MRKTISAMCVIASVLIAVVLAFMGEWTKASYFMTVAVFSKLNGGN